MTPEVWWRKKPKTLVAAPCPLCGIVTVPISAVKVSATTNSVSLTCPVCDATLVVALRPDEDMLLMSHGAEVVL